MNPNSPNNIDGFTLRRRNTTNNAKPRLGNDKLPVPKQFLVTGVKANEQQSSIDQRPTSSSVGQAGTTAASHHLAQEIDASLRSIDEEAPKVAKKRKRPKLRIKYILIALAFLAVFGLGYFGLKIFLAGNNIFNGNLFDVFSNKSLKRDSFGRTNILMFGTSEDSPAHIEEGSGSLTDSIMVISLDQDKKNAVMFSVPRDLWVDYGQACISGYQGKINVVYECAKEGTSVQAGAQKLKGIVGEVFGLDIQYYAKVNYSALKDAVNAVGGINVTIDSDDPRGVYDPNFDWQCNFRCKMVKWPNGPAQLDGEHALALARARNAAGGYGLGGGNFDREQYQQKILLAVKEKAVSAGTLANPIAVSGLIDSLGNNIETNFETSELKTLVELAGSINKTSIKSISLVDKNEPLVTTGSYSGQSIVRPVAGISDFSEIQSYIRLQLSGNTNTGEDATIEVLNGTDLSGIASKKETEFESQGLVITSIGDAPTRSSYGKLQWFDLTGGSKPQTANKLMEVLKEPNSGSSLPEGVQSDADFVIIIGNGAN